MRSDPCVRDCSQRRPNALEHQFLLSAAEGRAHQPGSTVDRQACRMTVEIEEVPAVGGFFRVEAAVARGIALGSTAREANEDATRGKPSRPVRNQWAELSGERVGSVSWRVCAVAGGCASWR
jgi:hypothetical protein